MVFNDQNVPLLRCHCLVQGTSSGKGSCDAAPRQCVPCHFREKNPRKRVRHLRGTLAQLLDAAPTAGGAPSAPDVVTRWMVQAARVLALLGQHDQMVLHGASGAACTLREVARDLCSAGALEMLLEVLHRASADNGTPETTHLAALASECLLHLARFPPHADTLLQQPRCLPLLARWLARGPWALRALLADVVTTLLAMAWRGPEARGAVAGETGVVEAMAAMARVTVEEVEEDIGGPCGDLVSLLVLRACHPEGSQHEPPALTSPYISGPAGPHARRQDAAPMPASQTARSHARALAPAFTWHVRKAGLTALTYALSAAVAPTLAAEDGTLDAIGPCQAPCTEPHKTRPTQAALEPLLVPVLLLNLLTVTRPVGPSTDQTHRERSPCGHCNPCHDGQQGGTCCPHLSPATSGHVRTQAPTLGAASAGVAAADCASPALPSPAPPSAATLPPGACSHANDEVASDSTSCVPASVPAESIMCCMTLAARCLACLCAKPWSEGERDTLARIRPAGPVAAPPPPQLCGMTESLWVEDYVWVDKDEDDECQHPAFGAHLMLSLHEGQLLGPATAGLPVPRPGVSDRRDCCSALPVALSESMVHLLATLEWTLVALRALTDGSSTPDASRLSLLLASVSGPSAQKCQAKGHCQQVAADSHGTGDIAWAHVMPPRGHDDSSNSSNKDKCSNNESGGSSSSNVSATEAVAQVPGGALIARLSATHIPALLEGACLLGHCVAALSRRPVVAAAQRNQAAALPSLLAILADDKALECTSTAAATNAHQAGGLSSATKGGGPEGHASALGEALEETCTPLVAPFIEAQDMEDGEAGSAPLDRAAASTLRTGQPAYSTSGEREEPPLHKLGRLPLVLARAPPLVDSALLALVCFAAVVLPSQRSFLPADFGWRLHARVEKRRQTANGHLREGQLLRAVSGYTSALLHAQLLQRYTDAASHPATTTSSGTTLPHEPGADQGQMAVLWSNRAEAFLRCGWPAAALRDVCQALRLQPGHEKSLARRDRALEACRVVGCAAA
eukprot:jgi/Mesvir1/4358/Mv02441-RA.1